MSECFLIRHGQASFGAANYDALSPLGVQQSLWLGEYFRARALMPSRWLIGGQVRHRQTAQAINESLGGAADFEVDEGWNEFDFQALVQVYCQRFEAKLPTPADPPREFFKLMRKAMLAWSEGYLDLDAAETWAQFQARIVAALTRIRQGATGGPVFVIGSSGSISAALMQIMGFGAAAHIDLYFQARNTGITQLFFNADHFKVSGFNYVPHLDLPGRSHALSFI